MPRPIALLDPAVANQIAAGEVVERPASVVKELVENAVDAGATRVSVRIEDGGKRLIRVTDNGCGLSAEEARLAFARHATSKLASADDLSDIRTFGFRGEALASILAVARVTMTTRRAADAVGVCVRGAGGVDLEVRPAGCAIGTDLLIEELFFNVPARLGFLRTSPTETGRVVDFIDTLGLARPDLHLSLFAGDKRLVDLPPDRDVHQRAGAVLGAGIAARLYPIEDHHEFAVRGLLSDPGLAQHGPGQLRILVNGRPVSDRTLLQAVAQAYGTLVERGRYPIGVLWIDCPPGTVDVNVHPAKSEVRFAAPASVFGAVVRAIRAMIAVTPWVRRELPRPGRGAAPQREPPAEVDGRDGGSASAALESPPPAPPPEDGGARDPDSDGGEPPLPAAAAATFAPSPPPDRAEAGPASRASGPIQPALWGEASGRWSALRYVGQVGRCYLVCEGDGALVLIDQHAAHERVLYERFVAALDAGPLPAQRLMVPIAVPLSPAEVAVLGDAADLVERFGFEIGAAGERLVRVHAHPTILPDRLVASSVRELAASLCAGGRGQAVEERLLRHAATLACHAALRAGDPIHPADVVQLFAELDATDRSAYCPHGRPVWMRAPFDEVGRWFRRP